MRSDINITCSTMSNIGVKKAEISSIAPKSFQREYSSHHLERSHFSFNWDMYVCAYVIMPEYLYAFAFHSHSYLWKLEGGSLLKIYVGASKSLNMTKKQRNMYFPENVEH